MRVASSSMQILGASAAPGLTKSGGFQAVWINLDQVCPHVAHTGAAATFILG